MSMPLGGASAARAPRSPSHRSVACLLVATLSLSLSLAPAATAQDGDPEVDDLTRRLEQALASIDALQRRVAALEALRLSRAPGQPADDALEAQLQALLVPEPSDGPRTVFPSAGNPRIGVFMDAVAEAGNAQEKLGEGDRFSLRETEVDFRLPISPFAEGVLVTTFEDVGGGEFETHLEEGYADVALGALLDTETAAKVKVGRFRAPFGHDNRLHTHDLIQVDRPFALTQQLGGEGLIGDGVEVSLPLLHREDEEGRGSTTTATVALVNGEIFTGEESLLGELADGAGIGLDSDAPLVITRLSHFMELGELSDAEVGASWLAAPGSTAVQTDTALAAKITPRVLGLDATLRTRDDESGAGSWLFQAEAIRSDYDFGASGVAGFPAGNDRSSGAWFTAQRQTGPSTYLGLRVGQTEVLGTDGADEILDLSPYVTWYADEFFRLRLQGQHLDLETAGGDDDVNRVFLQSTWNFGAHLPHPYWTNR